MSRPLSFTIMIMPEMMLKAATRMIRVRIRNITLRSISTALTRVELEPLPIDEADLAAERGGDALTHAARLVGVGQEDFEVGDRLGHAEEHLGRRSGT